MPAIAEADDGFMYVLKFRGAGQGRKALIAELLGGEIARLLGFRVPELVFAVLDEAFGRTEPDEEIQDLLKASTGLNLALHYLSGSVTFDPLVEQVDPLLASKIVWLDVLLTNMDRSARNTNMLLWHKQLWLIDHGAALYFHHSGKPYAAQATKRFDLVGNHVLLPRATQLQEAQQQFKPLLTHEALAHIISMIPGDWLDDEQQYATAAAHRQAYLEYLLARVAHSEQFVKETIDAQQALI
jgi:hypothetical protein